jgi:molybdate transport system substrate-binding protein
MEMQMKFGLMAATTLGALLMTQTAQAAEIQLFASGAARRSLEEIVPQFERASGHKLVIQYELPPALVRKVDAGEPFDVLILSYDVEGLIKQGKLAEGSRVALGRIGVGVAVRRGDPKPEFGSVEAFKKSLLDAKSFATSGDGSSGRHVTRLIERLGIAEQVKHKIKTGPSGTTAKLLSAGEVDFVVSGLPPLLGPTNIEWLGYLPEELNEWLVFSGGINVKAKEPGAGRAFLNFLTTAPAAAVFKANGLEPMTP